MKFNHHKILDFVHLFDYEKKNISKFNWLETAQKSTTALLIEGAKRIGKIYIVETFAQNEYKSYILIDFSKKSPQVVEFFSSYLDDLDTLFLNLEVYFRTKLHPRQSSDTEARSLIIFDEIQFCPPRPRCN